MQKLIDLSDGDLLQRGFFPSLPDNQQELWRTGTNVEFRDRRVIKAVGFDVLVPSASEIKAINQAFVDGVKRAYWAEVANVFQVSDGVFTQIGSGFTGPGYWSLETWGTWLLATNETNVPQIWKNAGLMVPLAGFTGVRADRHYRILKKHQNHMLGYFKQRVDWSHESDVETWVPDIENSAGGFDIRDLDSDIVAVCGLGKDRAIYSNDSMVVQRYVGAPFYFGFEQALKNAGATSAYAALDVSNKNYVFGRKNIYVTDGFSAEPIDNPQINDWIYSQFNANLARKVTGVHDEKNQTVKWWFPCMDGVRRGVSYRYVNGAWGMLQQPVSAAAEHEVFDAPLIGTNNSLGFMTGGTLGAAAQASDIETFPLNAGDREKYKLWDMYRTEGELAGLEVRFGFQDTLQNDDGSDTAVDWSAWEPLVRENYIDRESVFLRVAMRSSGPPWRLSGFSIHGEKTGYL